MIKLVSDNYIKKEYASEFIILAKELKKNSLIEAGNYAYDFYQDVNNIGHITFIEKWKSIEAIKHHNEMTYFINFVEKTKDMKEKNSNTALYNDIAGELMEYDPFNIELGPKDIKDYPFLIVSQANNKVNAMTANWGMLGNMWNQPTFLSVVRKTRYTKELLDNSNYFSICFFEGYKKELGYLGTVSGKDTDKIKDVGFSVEYIEDVPYIKEANEVYILKKNFNIDMQESSILDKAVIDKWYTNGIDNDNYHTIYFGSIIKYLKR